MITAYLIRGAKTGTVGGLVYGLFVALLGNGLVGFAETFEEEHAELGGPVVSEAVTVFVSILSGGLWGVFLGIVVFGLGYYFLEPLIPGAGDTKSYLLGAGGFIVASGGPWLILPPQPPGVEQALATNTRILWYAVAMIVGGVAWLLSMAAYNRFNDRTPLAVVAALLPYSLLLIPVLAAPSNPVAGPIPEGLAVTFRWVVVFGNVLLWIVLASTHAWLIRRAEEPAPVALNVQDADSTASIET